MQPIPAAVGVCGVLSVCDTAGSSRSVLGRRFGDDVAAIGFQLELAAQDALASRLLLR